MSQDNFEKNDETKEEPQKMDVNDIESKNTPIKLNESQIKELTPIVAQVISFEENARKALSVIDKKIFPGKLKSLDKLEKSTRIILKIFEESIHHKILDVDAGKYLKEIENSYLDLDQEMRDVSNVSIVTQGLLINDLDLRVEKLLQMERTHISALEEELRAKEESISHLLKLLENQSR